MKLFKKALAEFIGTFALVLVGCGVAAVTSMSGSSYTGGGAHLVGTAVAFGFILATVVYCIGGISGAHVNPAISLGVLLKNLFLPKDKREFGWKEFFVYVLAQILGAIVGCLGLWAILGKNCGFGANQIQPLVENGRSTPYFVAVLVEIILSLIFVFAVLAITHRKRRINGLIIGVALTAVHLVGIPLTGTSVNPARSIGPAIFALLSGNSVPAQQLWIFILCPLVGAGLAALAYWFVFIWKKDPEEEKKDEIKAGTTIINYNNYYGTKEGEPTENKEETPVEETPAEEEKPVEEPVEEEPTEEPVEETPAEEEKPVEESVEETPVEEPVEEEPTDVEDNEGVTTSERKKQVPFVDRLVAADPELKEKYEELKAYCESYGLHGRTSVSYDTYRLHRTRYVVFSIRGKAIKMHVALDPQDYKDSTITLKDDSAKTKYADVPGYIRVKSPLSVKRAKILIDDAMAKAKIQKI